MRQQLLLVAEAGRPEAVTIPQEIERDLIEALATLLLEAAGVIGGAKEGGHDESEDYA